MAIPIRLEAGLNSLNNFITVCGMIGRVKFISRDRDCLVANAIHCGGFSSQCDTVFAKIDMPQP